MREEDSVSVLKGVGEKTQKALASIGVETIGDLIRRYPAGYDSFDAITTIGQAESGRICTLRGCLAGMPQTRYTGKLVMTQIGFDDGSGKITLTWFRMPYLKNVLKPGEVRIIRGKLVRNRFGTSMEQPTIYSEEEYAALQSSLQPIYPLNPKVTGKQFRKLCVQALEHLTLSQDYLPKAIRLRYGLAEWNDAIRTIHFPKDQEEMFFARKRLVFDEFLLFILAIRRLKEKKEKDPNLFFWNKSSWTEKFLAALPYRLTGAQQRVWEEIRQDMTGEKLMNRLIQGDVGSGKTVLAQLALLFAAENGYQGAIMAPTEVLARQHYESFTKMFAQYNIPVRCALLTGSMTVKQKREAARQIREHEVDIVIGTHALIQEGVRYDQLALVITDEQHRFGVHQREMLAGKAVVKPENPSETGKTAAKTEEPSEGGKAMPHILVMSATPIPRTLAIIIYGDMDISVVDELPANRLPIKNCVVDTSYRPKAYEFIRNQVREGRQVYVICPMVEETEGYDGENVIDYTEKLRGVLPAALRVEYLHGRMKPKEKAARMEAFASGEIQVLVSTTVVEVGVNVPNATVMMIENAEKFGLAQLHQLRGRVGRGKYQSYCIFVNASGEAEKNRRLEVLNRTNDGFAIASEDLKLRGPGDVFGIRQSGDLEFVLGDIYTDSRILQDAAEAADRILAEDPELEKDETKALLAQLKRYQKDSWERMYL